MSIQDPSFHNADASTFELTEDGNLLPASNSINIRRVYEDGSSIDWLHEESAERERLHLLRSQRGVRGILGPLMDDFRTWFVIGVTGIGIGLAGAWLDVLVKWLSDLREGHCSYGLFYNSVACCSGLDAGDICREWQSWSETFHIRSLLAESLLQSFVYITLAVAFSGSAAVLVKTYALYAFHTGIPEIKAILGGYVFDAFLTPWNLLIKALGLALAVASGLSLGKEGPLVHVACCMAYALSRLFVQFRQSETQKRKLLAAAAAAGVSVAFGSPLGGVLFGLEELDTFGNESDVMWRGFVTSVLAAVTLQYIDPFGTAKLVLFQVTSATDNKWRAFELVPWLLLSIIGGILGSFLIKLNVSIALYRHRSPLRQWPVLEVLTVAGITGAVSYLIVFSRVQSSELVANLFLECDPTRGDYHGLCNPTAMWENVFLLILTAALKIGLTAWTFGMMIPAGIFLPTIAIGACLGRAVGLLVQGLHRAYPDAWIFLSCPPDPSIRCVFPGFYAVIGASAMLAGVTRMTISLVVILFELTGALSHVLPIMMSVMTAKWVGDALNKHGIYAAWIAMRGYPWLPPVDYTDRGKTGAHVMKRVERLVVVEDGECTVRELVEILKEHQFHGFPVVYQGELLGYLVREKIGSIVGLMLSEDMNSGISRRCIFSTRSATYRSNMPQVNLSAFLDSSVLQLRDSIPQQVVVGLFQSLNLRHILFSSGGKLTGMVTKRDVVSLLTDDFPYARALSGMPGNDWETPVR